MEGTSAILGYKETEEDSLPRRQCHRWHCRLDSVLPWRRTLFVRFMLNIGAKRDRTARNRTSAIPGYKETNRDSLPKRQCHVALSSRQCSSLASYLARSIYDEHWCEAGSRARNRTSALLRYKETEEDSLPRRQCHRVALSSRQCSFLASYLVRSIYDEHWCEAGSRARNRAPALLGYKETEEDSLPRRQCHRWHCRLDSVLSWRRTLFVRFMMNIGAKQALVRGTGLRRSQATRERKKIHCRDGSATWHCRLDSVLSWRRTLLVRFMMNIGAKQALVRGGGPRRS